MVQAMGDGGLRVRFWLGKAHVMFTTPFPSLGSD